MRRDELQTQMEPGNTSVTNTMCLVEEIGHRKLKARVSFTQYLCGSKEGQDAETKRNTGVRVHGKGLGMEVRMHAIRRVKIGPTVRLEWGLCRRDKQPRLCRH